MQGVYITLFFDHFLRPLECAIGDSKPSEGETVAPVH